MEKVGQITDLIEQTDDKKAGQEAIEKDGALDGHGLCASPGWPILSREP
jgi:hypothetical protein